MTPFRPRAPLRWIAALAVVALALASPAAAAEYTGPLIDAHAHVPNATAIDAFVAAMKRHQVTRVLLLGVGGVQPQDSAWIAGAVQKYPDRVLAAAPVPDPTAATAAARLDETLRTGRFRAAGEVHVRQVSRKIARDPDSAAFAGILKVVATHGVPLVIHCELDDPTAAALGRALEKHPRAIVVLAHAGSAPPAQVDALLARHANLMVDLSGMHFQRTPALATETGPLDPAWKALIEKRPDRFLMGIDAWAPRLFEPPMLDRLMRWTRRILGELPAAVAEQVAHRNAARLLRAE